MDNLTNNKIILEKRTPSRVRSKPMFLTYLFENDYFLTEDEKFD